MNIEKLNKGLARIVSVKPLKEHIHPYVAKHKRGRVFHTAILHKWPMLDTFLEHNKKGFATSHVKSVAHSPSLYYWLFHRCGVAFAETNELVAHNRLKVNGTLITRQSDLESQLEWSTFESLDIQIRSSVPYAPHRKTTHQFIKDNAAHNSSTVDCKVNKEQDTNTMHDFSELAPGPWVPALKRALHRVYGFMYFSPHISIENDESDPLSFRHRLRPHFANESDVIALNVNHPAGVRSGMRALGIITNDVSSVQYWNNQFLGNYGVYDIRFMRGTPLEVIEAASRDVTQVLIKVVKPQLASYLQIPCSCKLSKIADPTHDWLPLLFRNTLLHDWHLMVSTPLMPSRLVYRLRQNGGFVTLVRSGPFVLHPSLVAMQKEQEREEYEKQEYSEERNNVVNRKRIQPQYMRLMSPAEMAVFFTFERKLKTNRMLLTLHDFDNIDDNDISVENDKSWHDNANDAFGKRSIKNNNNKKSSNQGQYVVKTARSENDNSNSNNIDKYRSNDTVDIDEMMFSEGEDDDDVDDNDSQNTHNDRNNT